MRIPWNERATKKVLIKKKTAARMYPRVAPFLFVRLTASSTASKPNDVVNLITGFMATDEVSLKGSPTVSPMTVAS